MNFEFKGAIKSLPQSVIASYVATIYSAPVREDREGIYVPSGRFAWMDAWMEHCKN